MTTLRRGSAIIFRCDGCDEFLNTETDDFADANGVRNREGWIARKDGQAWQHYCPSCKGANA